MSLTQNEINDYFKAHNKAISFYKAAVDDYLGARCCLHNLILHPGYFLASQAIEKFIKCHILLVKPKENFRSREGKRREYPIHHLPTLLTKLKERAGVDLTMYMSLCEKLTIAWEAFRYPDNDPKNYSLKGWVSTNKIIRAVDELFFNLFDYLPFHGAINVRTGILSVLNFDNAPQIKDALKRDNWSYMSRADRLIKPFEWWAEQPFKRREKMVFIVDIDFTL